MTICSPGSASRTLKRDAVQIGHRLDQAEAQPAAGRRAAVLQPVKTLENALAFLGRRAGTVVGDDADDMLAVAAERDFDARAGGRVPDGILD